MSVSRLSVPDCGDEHTKPRWSCRVATALCRAYQLVDAGDLSGAATCVRPLMDGLMGDFQRVRTLYLVSLDAANTDLQAAFDLIEEALDLAADVDDLDACATLAYHGATVLHLMQHFAPAADYYDIALDALRSQPDADPLGRAPREYDLLVSRAVEDFYGADFDGAGTFLSEAQRLPLAGQHHELRVARAEWTATLLARWRGDHAIALQHALAAHDVYARCGAPVERARMRLALADVYLDHASPPGMVPLSAERGRIIELAERPLMDALASTRVTEDETGEGLALLTYARYVRAAKRDENALHVIATAEDIGRRLNDLPLIAQAHTARGAELMAQGEVSQALASFQGAVAVLRNTDVPVQAIWPKRSLLIYQEMQ